MDRATLDMLTRALYLQNVQNGIMFTLVREIYKDHGVLLGKNIELKFKANHTALDKLIRDLEQSAATP